MKAAVAACLLVLALLAWQVVAGGVLPGQDERLTLWLAAHRQGWLTQAMLAVSEAHRTLGILAATAAIGAWLAWRRRRRDALALLAVPAAMLVNVATKNVFQRMRPVLEEPLVHLTTYSFPSGHAVASSVFYGTLCGIALTHLRRRGARAAAVAAAVAMVLLVCFSRVYLGAHFFTDVLAGVAVGLAWVLVTRRVLS